MYTFVFQDNTLQVVIATNGQVSFVLYIYSNIEWGVANIGFNAGDNVRSFMVPGARTFQTRNIENGSNVNIPGLYMYRVDRRLVFDGENYNVLSPIAPIHVRTKQNKQQLQDIYHHQRSTP